MPNTNTVNIKPSSANAVNIKPSSANSVEFTSYWNESTSNKYGAFKYGTSHQYGATSLSSLGKKFTHTDTKVL